MNELLHATQVSRTKASPTVVGSFLTFCKRYSQFNLSPTYKTSLGINISKVILPCKKYTNIHIRFCWGFLCLFIENLILLLEIDLIFYCATYLFLTNALISSFYLILNLNISTTFGLIIFVNLNCHKKRWQHLTHFVIALKNLTSSLYHSRIFSHIIFYKPCLSLNSIATTLFW